MRARVEYLSWLSSVVGRKSDVLEINESDTLEILLQKLARRYGARFRDCIYSEAEGLNPHLQILVDGRNITDKEINLKLFEGCKLIIVPVIGGGSMA